MKLTKKHLIKLIKEEITNHLNEEDQWRDNLKGVEISYVKAVLGAIDSAVELGIRFDKIAAAIDEHIVQKGYDQPHKSAYEKHRAAHGMDDIE